jgi:hypothetical protein
MLSVDCLPDSRLLTPDAFTASARLAQTSALSKTDDEDDDDDEDAESLRFPVFIHFLNPTSYFLISSPRASLDAAERNG